MNANSFLWIPAGSGSRRGGRSRSSKGRRSEQAMGDGPGREPDPIDDPEPQGSLRILLVDDDKLNQELIAEILALDGFQVDVADNGQQAVEAAGRCAYDLVLMDIQMPVLDGLQATRQIRALPAPLCGVWIIALSGSGIATGQADYRVFGLDDYIVKPYHPDILRAKLSMVAQNRPALVPRTGDRH